MFSKKKDEQNKQKEEGLSELKDSPISKKSSDSQSGYQKSDGDQKQQNENKETDEQKQKIKQLLIKKSQQKAQSNEVHKEESINSKPMMCLFSNNSTNFEKKQPLAFGDQQQATSNLIPTPANPANSFSFGKGPSPPINLPDGTVKSQFFPPFEAKKNLSSSLIQPSPAIPCNSNMNFGSSSNPSLPTFKPMTSMPPMISPAGLNISPALPKPKQPEYQNFSGTIPTQSGSMFLGANQKPFKQLIPSPLQQPSTQIPNQNQMNNTNNDILLRIVKLQNQSKENQKKFSNLKEEFEKYKKENPSKKDYEELKKQHLELKSQFELKNNLNNTGKSPFNSNNNISSGNIFNNNASNNFNRGISSNAGNFGVASTTSTSQNEVLNMKQMKQSMNKLCEDLSKKNIEMTENMTKIISNSLKEFNNSISLGFGKLSTQIANINKQKKNNLFQNPPQNYCRSGNSWGNEPAANNLNNSFRSSAPPSLDNQSIFINKPLINPTQQQLNRFHNNYSLFTQNQQSGLSTLNSHLSSTQKISQFHFGYKVTYKKIPNHCIDDLCIENQFGKIQVLGYVNPFHSIEKTCSSVNIRKDCCTINDPSLEKHLIRLTSYNFMDYKYKQYEEQFEIKDMALKFSLQQNLNAHIDDTSGNLVIEMKAQNA